ncbi:J domain-containing protein [Cohnella terricola]|uniref:J domain-containing protein n=1 Tax=Cohnella terricola TaxID=1289167 RepID=A0A559J5C1_9BACL|nr:J domain-containing protein [Cohnella terricola]TVX95080.1 hypothetical protein FPZ45_24035 [Cohnella terricola]
MTPWELLGISRTNDIKAIKRAYAKQLKVHHPEDDPEGYQMLREAYDKVSSIAKRNRADIPMISDPPDIQLDEPITIAANPRIRIIDPPEDIQLDVPITKAVNPWIFVEEPTPLTPSRQTVEDFIARAIEIYEHFPSRIAPERWLELLNSEITWKIEYKQEISEQLLTILQSRRYLPVEIWKILEGFFGWEEVLNELEYSPSGRDPFLTYYIKQLSEPGLRYEFLLQADNIDRDQYLSYRQQVFEALKENKLELARVALNQAYLLYTDDPELLRLRGEYDLRMCNYEKALVAFDQVVKMLPDEIDSYLYQARIRYLRGEIPQAIEEYQFIVSHWPQHKEAMIMLGNCYVKIDHNVQAEECFKEVLKPSSDGTAPNHIQAVIGLAVINPNTIQVTSKAQSKKRHVSMKMRRLHTLIVVATSLIIFGFVSYMWHAIEDRRPIPITSLQELEEVPMGSFVSLKLSSTEDLGIRQYEVDRNTSSARLIYLVRDEQDKRIESFGLPLIGMNKIVYMTKIDEQHIILDSDFTQKLDVVIPEDPVIVTGYVKELLHTGDLMFSVYGVLIKRSETDSGPQIYARYIDATATPPGSNPIHVWNSIIIIAMGVLFIRSLIWLIVELRRERYAA